MIIIPMLIKMLQPYYSKQPYHTSVLSGYGWVLELLNGHPERIQTELGVHKHIFLTLVDELQLMGYSDKRDVKLEEKLAIFLYACVTGLTVRHLGERFQRANGTITKCVWNFLLIVHAHLIHAFAGIFERWLMLSAMLHFIPNMSSSPP